MVFGTLLTLQASNLQNDHFVRFSGQLPTFLVHFQETNFRFPVKYSPQLIQLTLTCSKLTIETSEKGVKYVQS